MKDCMSGSVTLTVRSCDRIFRNIYGPVKKRILDI